MKKWIWLLVIFGCFMFTINSFPILLQGRSMTQAEVNTALVGMALPWSFCGVIVSMDYFSSKEKKP